MIGKVEITRIKENRQRANNFTVINLICRLSIVFCTRFFRRGKKRRGPIGAINERSDPKERKEISFRFDAVGVIFPGFEKPRKHATLTEVGYKFYSKNPYYARRCMHNAAPNQWLEPRRHSSSSKIPDEKFRNRLVTVYDASSLLENAALLAKPRDK